MEPRNFFEAGADEALVDACVAEAGDVLAGLALFRLVEQRALEEQRMRRVDDDEARDAIGPGQRRHPRDRAAPVVANQSEAIDAEMVGERDQVGEDLLGGIGLHPLRLGRAGEAALVGRDDIMVAGEIGDHAAPRAVRFGKAVQQDDRRVRRVAGDRDVELDAGGQRDTGQRHVGHHSLLSQALRGSSCGEPSGLWSCRHARAQWHTDLPCHGCILADRHGETAR